MAMINRVKIQLKKGSFYILDETYLTILLFSRSIQPRRKDPMSTNALESSLWELVPIETTIIHLFPPLQKFFQRRRSGKQSYEHWKSMFGSYIWNSRIQF